MSKPIKDMSERELRDMGNIALKNMRELYEDKRAGKEITADREKQFDQWELETDAVEKEFELRRKQAAFEAGEGVKLYTKEEKKEEERKFDHNFKPSQREVNLAYRKLQERGEKKLNAEERKILTQEEIYQEVFERYFIAGLDINMVSEEDKKILNTYGKQARGFNPSNVESRAQSLTTTAGGYLVPQGFVPRVIRSLKFISSFFTEFQVGLNEVGNVFQIVRTDSGNDMPWPTGDDTSNVGELLAENSDASSSSADLVFGQLTLKAYKYSTKMIKTSTELLQDSAIDLPGYVADMFGSRIGRILNTHLTTGNNSSKPQGIVTGATAGKIGGTAGTILMTEIMDLEHSVDRSYRNTVCCRFMMHDLILKSLKKITVGSTTAYNVPAWVPGWDKGEPSTLLGYQYLVNNDMDSTFASGKKVILFGDMQQYAVRLVNQFRLLSLKERYAEFDQTAWVGFLRADGRILNSSAIKYYAGT